MHVTMFHQGKRVVMKSALFLSLLGGLTSCFESPASVVASNVQVMVSSVPSLVYLQCQVRNTGEKKATGVHVRFYYTKVDANTGNPRTFEDIGFVGDLKGGRSALAKGQLFTAPYGLIQYGISNVDWE